MSKSVAVLASVVSFVVACGGESTSPGDPPDPRAPAVPAVSATSAPAPPAETSPPPAAPSTTPPVAAAPKTPAGGGSSSGGPGQCEPDAACGGLSQCVDSCYTERCCYLGCACNASTGRLECGLRCGG